MAVFELRVVFLDNKFKIIGEFERATDAQREIPEIFNTDYVIDEGNAIHHYPPSSILKTILKEK